MFTAAYDAENRLTSLEYTDKLGVARKTEYAYSGDDFLAIVKQYENGALTDETRIVRDGFLALQDRNGQNVVRNEYTWGLNLGGGIGGLLDLKQGGVHYSYFYDGKGNVEAVLDWERNVAAAYRYDHFGKLLAKTGALDQPFQFSTKRFDVLTGLSYYGYRFYSTEPDRWTTRDPLGEAGGVNLYAFVGNNPVAWVDPWGLAHYLPNPNRKPPGWSPDWKTDTDNRGDYSQDPETGTKWYPHPENKGHWDHYDNDKGGSYPKQRGKPRPGQKKNFKPIQSPTDP